MIQYSNLKKGGVMIITLQGETPSKKNSRINTRSGRSFPNKKYMEWQKNAIEHIRALGIKGINSEAKTRYEIKMTFYHGDKRRRDSDNAVSSIFDMLVKSGILPDDNWQVIPRYEVNNEYTKGEPKCCIEIIGGE